METRSFIMGADWLSTRNLDRVRSVIEEYAVAARLGFTAFDIYGVVGQLDLDYSVDQNIYNYIHSDSCRDPEISQYLYGRKKIKCSISTLALLRNLGSVGEYYGDYLNCWVDDHGNFWPSNQLSHDREDREMYSDLAIRRWKDELEMSAEEASLDALSDVVAYCWYGGKARNMKVRTLADFLPRYLRPQGSGSGPSEQQLAAEAGYIIDSPRR